MRSRSVIEHPGTVEKILSDHILVRVLSVSACSGCHAREACTMAGMEEKMVEVKVEQPGHFHPGESVQLSIALSSGLRAVIIAYFFPLLMLVGALILGLSLKLGEGASALIAVSSVAVYYLCLWALRGRIQRATTFSVSK